jgi:hypothetical protein
MKSGIVVTNSPAFVTRKLWRFYSVFFTVVVVVVFVAATGVFL